MLIPELKKLIDPGNVRFKPRMSLTKIFEIASLEKE